jgi:predicted nucleic acid-binding protein
VSAYYDTSALFKLAVPEPGAEAVARAWVQTGEPFASLIGHTELHAALGRAVRNGRDVGLGSIAVDRVWDRVTPVGMDADLVRRAGSLAVRYGLGALDALHLSSALVVATEDSLMAFVTFDARLRSAAAAEGFQVLPVVA